MWPWNKNKKENDINIYDDSYLEDKIIIGKTKKAKKEKNVNDNKELDEYSIDSFDTYDTKKKKFKEGSRKEDWL
jgi:hypothetical protein